MKYKLADETKIEVEAGDFRRIVWIMEVNGFLDSPKRIKSKYPAAFEEAKEEWEDVTEKVYMGDVHGFELIVTHTGNYKIQNDRIWRRK